jgi:tripartite-type tricarboxylate transporter receptor subunit TctC
MVIKTLEAGGRHRESARRGWRYRRARDARIQRWTHPAVLTQLHGCRPYDPVRDIQPIASVTEDYLGVIVPPSFNAKTFDELIARARAAPGNINFITPPGVTLLLWQALQKRTGISMTHVPYRSVIAGIPDLMEGRVQLGIVPMSAILSQVRSGKLRVLAVASDARCPFAPDAPTLVEMGYENFVHRGLLGLYGPRSLAPALRDRISSDLHEAVADPVITKTLEQSGFVPAPTTPAELSELLARQRARWADMAARYQLKAH